MFRLNHGSKQFNATYYSNSGDSESFEAAPQCIFRLIFVFCMPRFILHLRLLQKTLRWVSVQATTPAGSDRLRSASEGLSKNGSPQALAPIHYQLLSNMGSHRVTSHRQRMHSSAGDYIVILYLRPPQGLNWGTTASMLVSLNRARGDGEEAVERVSICPSVFVGRWEAVDGGNATAIQ